jgi:hypothetical protein
MIMQASLARRSSSKDLDFWRVDYPDVDPPGSEKFVTTRLEGEAVRVRELPVGFWLDEPFAPDCAENYRIHSAP